MSESQLFEIAFESMLEIEILEILKDTESEAVKDAGIHVLHMRLKQQIDELIDETGELKRIEGA
jgi:hypothetical protein